MPKKFNLEEVNLNDAIQEETVKEMDSIISTKETTSEMNPFAISKFLCYACRQLNKKTKVSSYVSDNVQKLMSRTAIEKSLSEFIL